MNDTLDTLDLAVETLPEYDPNLPTFEIWVDGTRFISTQVPRLARDTYDRMVDSRRYGLRTLELRIVNDRRTVARVTTETATRGA